MTKWHLDPDQFVALALLDVDPAEQQVLAAHLAGCAECRAEYAATDDGLQQALAATPAIAPPAGFSGRVLDAMGVPAASVPWGSARGWRVRVLVAAAVLVGLLAGVGGTLALVGRNLPWDAGARPDVVAAALVTTAGATVGSVGVTQLDTREYLVISVTRGRADASYECFLIGADGARTSGGSWTLTSEYGQEASGAWAVPLAGDRPARVELVAPSGKVWAQAQF